jgi:hypothetical protein
VSWITVTINTDIAIFVLTGVLVILTIVLVFVGIDTSRKLKKVNLIMERFFHLGMLVAGGILEENVHLPIDWLKTDYRPIVDELSKVDGIGVALLDKEISITYRLNQETEALEILLRDCREPEKIREKFSLYSRL